MPLFLCSPDSNPTSWTASSLSLLSKNRNPKISTKFNFKSLISKAAAPSSFPSIEDRLEVSVDWIYDCGAGCRRDRSIEDRLEYYGSYIQMIQLELVKSLILGAACKGISSRISGGGGMRDRSSGVGAGFGWGVGGGFGGGTAKGDFGRGGGGGSAGGYGGGYGGGGPGGGGGGRGGGGGGGGVGWVGGGGSLLGVCVVTVLLMLVIMNIYVLFLFSRTSIVERSDGRSC